MQYLLELVFLDMVARQEDVEHLSLRCLLTVSGGHLNYNTIPSEPNKKPKSSNVKYRSRAGYMYVPRER